jgi:hypothetical protein
MQTTVTHSTAVAALTTAEATVTATHTTAAAAVTQQLLLPVLLQPQLLLPAGLVSVS